MPMPRITWDDVQQHEFLRLLVEPGHGRLWHAPLGEIELAGVFAED